MNKSIESRYAGSLLGLAVGDALGAPVEFMKPGTFKPISDMQGGGHFRLPAGYWTDDTSMALCLAESLIACQKFDADDQMQRYLRWISTGYHSSQKKAFGIGQTILKALTSYYRTGDVKKCGQTHTQSAGNGSLMRLAPIPLFYFNDIEKAVFFSGESSRTTHASQVCIDACRLFGGFIWQALHGASKDEIFVFAHAYANEDKNLHPDIASIANGSFLHKNPPEIVATGYVACSLEAALWAFAKADNFKDGALVAVNLGNDADTVGAIYGQLAGAYWGIKNIPPEWLKILYNADAIKELALHLYSISKTSI